MPKSALHPTITFTKSVLEIPHNGGDDYASWLVERSTNGFVAANFWIEIETICCRNCF